MLPGMYPLVPGAAAVVPIEKSLTDSETSTTNTDAYSFATQAIGAADAARYVVVVATSRGANATISSATIGGVSASVVAEITSTQLNCAIIIAAVPTGTTATIAITWSASQSNCDISVYRLVGLASATAFDTDTDTSSATASLSIDCEAGGCVIAGSAFSNPSNDTQTWSGITEDTDLYVNDTLTTDHNHSAASQVFLTAQTGLSVTCAWGGSAANAQAAVAAAFSPG